MNTPSGFRSKGHGDDRKTYPIFDPTRNIGKPLKSSRYVDSSREQMHQIRAARRERDRQEQEYAMYVAKSLHGKGDVVTVSTPSRTTNLKLTTVKTDEVKFSEAEPHNLTERAAYFEGQIKQGKTVPPILVHKLTDGKYQVVDGHARLQAYRNMGVKEVPAVENSIGEVLGKIGKGLGRAAKIGAKATVHGARFDAKAARFGARTLGQVRTAYEEGRKRLWCDEGR